MSRNTTTIVCPSCGQKIKIPENSRFVAGIAIGKDSNLGKIVLPAADNDDETQHQCQPVNKAKERLQKLREAGIDTTGLFALHSSTGKDIIARMNENDEAVELPDDDPIFWSIRESEHIHENRLFRPWVMAQVFRQFAKKDHAAFSKFYRAKGIGYQFHMLEDEFKAQTKMFNTDKSNFEKRNYWFNNELVINILETFMDNIYKFVHSQKIHVRTSVREINGVHPKYILFKNHIIYLSHIECVFIKPVEDIILLIKKAKNPFDVYTALKRFNHEILPLWIRTFKEKIDSSWLDAFKGAGAYFTLENLILFHNVSLDVTREFKSQSERIETSMEILNKKRRDTTKGYILFGYLRKILSDNKIDIEKKRKEWAIQKAQKAALKRQMS